jgi:hypothetical protein
VPRRLSACGGSWPGSPAGPEPGQRRSHAEVLTAKANGLGNSRLALVEAVGALDAEAKALMALRVRSNGVGWTRAGRTPRARLAWIREQLGGAAGADEALGRLARLARRARETAG